MQHSSFTSKLSIAIFTDGSCHTQLKKGGWASIIFEETNKLVLGGHESNTSHQRMELTAVLESLRFLQKQNRLSQDITVYTDSQYVVDLLRRKSGFITSSFQTKKMKPIRNVDLVEGLVPFLNLPNIRWVKIKSHQRLSSAEAQLNREVDLLSRQRMRETVSNNF